MVILQDLRPLLPLLPTRFRNDDGTITSRFDEGREIYRIYWVLQSLYCVSPALADSSANRMRYRYTESIPSVTHILLGGQRGDANKIIFSHFTIPRVYIHTNNKSF